MNKLEEQIWDRYGSFELSHDKNKLIVDNINEFVQKHCIDFNRWCFDNYCYDYDLNQWREYSEEWVPHTTEQLFKLYIETL
jgi:hypothetical protein